MDINKTFQDLNNSRPGTITKKSLIELNQIKEYLTDDLARPDCKFLQSELIFNSVVEYVLNKKPNGLKKFLPVLITALEKEHLQLLEQISSLAKQKMAKIESFYTFDIKVVDEFLQYAKMKLQRGDPFYFKTLYADNLWTNKQFPKNMYNYLAYKLRTDPKIFTPNYIENMKGYFSLVGLGIEDEEKTTRMNQYFTSTPDPYSLNIPQAFNDVKSDILMSMSIMAENESLLGRIANDVIQKYSK